MEQESFHDRLSQISTIWVDLFQAHGGRTAEVGPARQRLLVRYTPAVYGYLRGATRDPDAADELFQEFALRLVRGDFRRADPGRGRFRDFLRTALSHLITDHWRRQAARPSSLTSEVAEPADRAAPLAEADRQFQALWRLELIEGTWRALERFEDLTGQPLHAVLRLRADHPELSAPQMADRLATRLGRPLTAEWIHKRLHLARQKFADLLLEEVAQSLEDPTAGALEAELFDLDLLERCRTALGRWRTPT